MGSFVLAPLAMAQVVPQTVSYRVGGADMEGKYYATGVAKAPTVIIAPDWDGYTAHEDRVAQKLTAQGMNVFVADVYGRDVRPQNPEESAREAGKLRSMPETWIARMKAAVDQTMRQPGVDKSRVSMYGYCLGGTGAIALARTGESRVRAYVAFHPGLDAGAPEDVRKIKAPILVLNGMDDPMVPESARNAFMDGMRAEDKGFRSVTYPKAVHAFTVIESGDDPSDGVAYNAFADGDSWREADRFLSLFAK